ncbi:MAG: Tic22 family protein [Leptolyngbyaceae bacterium]|nr:Tic22 family protein [Leptolyngbyaceae bacterium]
MKSLIRKGAAALTAGGIIVGSLISAGASALALTREEISQQLRHVPVFTVTDESGSPLVSEVSAEDDVPPVTQVFISQADAEAFISGLSEADPELASSVRVTAVSLGRIYEVALQGQEPDSRLEFIFVPQESQVQSAVTIIQEGTEETVEEFSGVPLFTARSVESDSDEFGYLTIQQGDREVVPMFFTSEDLQSLLSQISQNQPELASTLEEHVVRLEDLIFTLETSDNTDLQQIQLIPSSETLRYIQEQIEEEGQ